MSVRSARSTSHVLEAFFSFLSSTTLSTYAAQGDGFAQLVCPQGIALRSSMHTTVKTSFCLNFQL
jgi:hypothetical protein